MDHVVGDVARVAEQLDEAVAAPGRIAAARRRALLRVHHRGGRRPEPDRVGRPPARPHDGGREQVGVQLTEPPGGPAPPRPSPQQNPPRAPPLISPETPPNPPKT